MSLLSPVKHGCIGLIAGSDGLLNYEEESEHQADAADHYVRHTEERVLAPKLTEVTDQNGLGAVKACDFIVSDNIETESGPLLVILVNLACNVT